MYRIFLGVAALSLISFSSIAAPAEHCGLPTGEGVINAVSVKKSVVNISHGPMPAIGWGPMTMDFKTDRSVDLAAFAKGDKIHFMLEPARKKGEWRIAALCSLDVGEAAHEACMKSMHEAATKKAENSGRDCVMAQPDGHEGHEGHH
ncbi:MAG: copper-binding protein [Parvularculaceae bacterium]